MECWQQLSSPAAQEADKVGARSGPPRSGLSAPSSLAWARHRLAMAACLAAHGVLIIGARPGKQVAVGL
jgi:hypothetical protein